MALTEDDIKRIVAATHGHCQCNLTPEAQGELGHLMGMVRDVGGNLGYAAGIENIRENQKFLTRYKRRGEKIGLAIVSFISISLIGGVIVVCKSGIVAIIKAMQSP